jgi:hypothetical protein
VPNTGLVTKNGLFLPVLLPINKQIKVVIKNLPSAAVALPERPESKGKRPSLSAGCNKRMTDDLQIKNKLQKLNVTRADSTLSPLKNEGGH